VGTSPSTAIADELRVTLWRTAGPATRDRATELGDAIRRLEASGPDPELVERAIPLAHAIAGSAGIFGVPSAARDAREVERVLRALRDGAAEALPVAPLGELVERIARELDSSLGGAS
jgi:chemotaxis protein histidine kinase CheA